MKNEEKKPKVTRRKIKVAPEPIQSETTAETKITSPEPIESEELTTNQVIDLLVELPKTPYWKAIRRYNADRCALINDSLYSIDPFKEPTKMAQNQGIRIGLLDLEGFVVEEIERRKKVNEELENKNKPVFGGQGY